MHVLAIASHLLDAIGPMDAMKLQKLVYYVQAVHLVRTQKPAFASPIEAWAYGPVVPALYDQHRGKYIVKSVPGGHLEDGRVDEEVIASCRFVVEKLGSLSGAELSQKTHSERPWQESRRGLRGGDRGDGTILPERMLEFYSNDPLFMS